MQSMHEQTNHPGAARGQCSTSLLVPRVIFADGCSGSTAVLALAAKLLQRSGVRAALPVYEPMVCAQNRFCAGDVVEALRTEVHWAASQCRAALLKGHCGMDSAWPAYAKALKANGARVVTTYRRNALDIAICEVRDCMHREGASLGRTVSSNCSIARRGLPRPAQPTVYLEPSRIAGALRKRLFRNAMACVRSSWPDAPRFASDDLLAFQSRAEEQQVLNASARAWSGLLTRLGAASTYESVRSELRAMAPGRARASAPSHAQALVNAREVRAALQAAGLARLWRE